MKNEDEHKDGSGQPCCNVSHVAFSKMPRDKHGRPTSEASDTAAYNRRKLREKLRTERAGDESTLDIDCPFVKAYLHVQAEKARLTKAS